MKHNIQVTVNGKPYEVEIDDLHTSLMTVLVNGQAYEVSLETAAETPAPAMTVKPAPLAPPRPAHSPAPASPGSGDALTAPMPGVILDIAVKAGDTVAYGQPLCSLEAMKMKNAIRAPREVTIASVEVQDGQRVNYGDVLFKFSA